LLYAAAGLHDVALGNDVISAVGPDSADAHFLAGKAPFELGRLPEASPELARAAKLNLADSKPHSLLARIYDQLGQPDRARSERENFARIQGRAGQPGMATANPVLVLRQ